MRITAGEMSSEPCERLNGQVHDISDGLDVVFQADGDYGQDPSRLARQCDTHDIVLSRAQLTPW